MGWTSEFPLSAHHIEQLLRELFAQVSPSHWAGLEVQDVAVVTSSVWCCFYDPHKRECRVCSTVVWCTTHTKKKSTKKPTNQHIFLWIQNMCHIISKYILAYHLGWLHSSLQQNTAIAEVHSVLPLGSLWQETTQLYVQIWKEKLERYYMVLWSGHRYFVCWDPEVQCVISKAIITAGFFVWLDFLMLSQMAIFS